MQTIKKITSLFLFVAIALAAAATTFAADAKKIKGQMLSMDSQQNSIIVNVEVLGLAGQEKKAVNFALDSNVKWTVCLSGQCVEKERVEGFNLANEYAAFEAYGITPKGSNTTLIQSENTITSVKVNL
ncbi:MAG: hypothetical protein HZB80_02330 [Deltaproteobacteria bacterium]|nr:hypothetical protein [Deltaproteobacteria bacterium]